MRKLRLVVALLICFIMVSGVMLPNFSQNKAEAAPGPSDTWRQVDLADFQIGKSYLIVSEIGALANAQATIDTPGDVTGDTQIGMLSKPVTIDEEGLITSEVTDDMIWQFGLGTNTAAASGGLGEGPGYHVLNNAPGAGGGTEPLRRESSFNAQHAPLNTTGAAINGNQQSMLMHVLDENEGTVSLYIWGGNSQWNMALTSTESGYTAKSKAASTTSAAQLLAQMQESPALRLYEPNVTVGVQHYVMASSGTNGSISPSSLAGHVWVNDGEDVTFTFNPAFGFEVDKVTVNGEEVAVTDNTYTIENVTASSTSIHVTFKPASNAGDLPFTVYNDIFSVGNVTTAVIIDLGEGNAANLADLSADMFTAAAKNTRLDGSTVIFDGLRNITRVYVNNDPEPLGYISPAPGSDDLVTDMPASGRYIIVELEFWNVNGYTSGAMVSGNLQNAYSAILNYRVNVDREIKLTNGTAVTPSFTQVAVVNPALDKFVPDKTNPGGTGSMDILISIDESWEDEGPLPLFIYNHGGGRGGPSGDFFAPMQTANGAAVLSKRQLENPGKYNAHIIATQNHADNQTNNLALIAYVGKLAAEGKVDPSRVYMSGFSMGSMYTLGFFNRNPEFLAAIVPLAGGNLPNVAQLTANPEYTKTAIWLNAHKNDTTGAGTSWRQYFETGAGTSGLYLEANVSILETNQAFNFPYYGFDWTPHETEAQVFSNLIGQSNISFKSGNHAEYADKNIFDWMFDQQRKNTTSSATLSGPDLVKFGDTFDVTYGLESLKQEVYAQDITIEYDADKLDLVGEPVSVDTLKFEILDTDKLEGIIRIIGIHLNESANNPNQDLFKLSFKAKTTAGIADIEVTQLVLADGNGVEAEIDGDTHKVKIEKPITTGDFNDDSRVSVGDLALLAKAYGKSSDSPDWDLVKQYDLNKDGTVDIEDLVKLARLILNK
ncbi:putative peptidase/Ca2+-binding EF-hand superfamily protein [Paenibacillus endophyticus]|uniref:Putative peptidase/Ca2+-binding EF-hand superfamily protein n=1 Tax=Paenibacillus endophyticus TaxID=1294268 RepID=A0A7W5CFF1_9BACL|nr:cohesin domain-containing protein [Paenibacillus endophyticus]MBB3155914.1 putative peptidase/Ca2+-binding EF-hand superfamily protein [Paenibacillus endophyticus]